MNREQRRVALMLAFISGLILTGCNPPNHAVRAVIKDGEVTTHVQQALLDSKVLKKLDIKVATRKGDLNRTAFTRHPTSSKNNSFHTP